MKTESQEQLINDKSPSRAETLTDLPVDEAYAEERKGGVARKRRVSRCHGENDSHEELTCTDQNPRVILNGE